MREQKNVSAMSDRELRAFKRKIRRQREQRKKIASVILTVCLITICVVSYHSLTSSANTGTEEFSFKYYTDVTIKYGESLWNIADEYIDYSHYDNKADYIKEVCSINNLEDASEICSGQTLVVPYYSTEFVK